MIDRLRKPGGVLGALSLLSAVALAVLGLVGAVAMLYSLATGADFWSDARSDLLGGLLFFVLTFSGAVGFVVMDRFPWPGAALAVVGGLAISILTFWAVFTIAIGLGAAAVGVVRARALSRGTSPAPTPA